MRKVRNVLIGLIAVIIGLRYSPIYPKPLEKFIAQSLDALEEFEYPEFLETLFTTAVKSIGIVNHGAHFTMDLKNSNFFEGWYYKIVSKDLKTTVITIPAVFFDKDNLNHHGFLMHGVIHHNEDGTVRRDIHIQNYTKSDVTITNYPGDKFELKLGSSTFKNDYFSLDVEGLVKGEIKFNQVVEYPLTLLTPSIMGIFTYIDAIFGMQCVHKVLTIDSKTSGELSILHGSPIKVNFNAGRGYIEGDYGSEFPNKYVWMASNHFSSNRGSSVLLSFAKVPFPNEKYQLFEFEGFLGYVYDAANEKFFKFGTYTGATIEVDGGGLTNTLQKKSKVSFVIRDLQHIIEITAVGNRDDALLIWGPKKNSEGVFKMSRYIEEMLDVQIHVSIRKRSDESLVFEGIGLKGGLEIEI